MSDVRTIAVRVEPKVHKRVRIQAAHEDRSLSDVVRDALEAYLAKNGAPATNGDPDGPSEAQKSA